MKIKCICKYNKRSIYYLNLVVFNIEVGIAIEIGPLHLYSESALLQTASPYLHNQSSIGHLHVRQRQCVMNDGVTGKSCFQFRQRALLN